MRCCECGVFVPARNKWGAGQCNQQISSAHGLAYSHNGFASHCLFWETRECSNEEEKDRVLRYWSSSASLAAAGRQADKRPLSTNTIPYRETGDCVRAAARASLSSPTEKKQGALSVASEQASPRPTAHRLAGKNRSGCIGNSLGVDSPSRWTRQGDGWGLFCVVLCRWLGRKRAASSCASPPRWSLSLSHRPLGPSVLYNLAVALVAARN